MRLQIYNINVINFKPGKTFKVTKYQTQYYVRTAERNILKLRGCIECMKNYFEENVQRN